MTLRFQRLLLILFTLMLLSGSVLLILNNSKKNLVFFYTPSELIKSNLPLNKIVRVGAFVAKNSLNMINANTYEFRITDENVTLDFQMDGKPNQVIVEKDYDDDLGVEFEEMKFIVQTVTNNRIEKLLITKKL